MKYFYSFIFLTLLLVTAGCPGGGDSSDSGSLAINTPTADGKEFPGRGIAALFRGALQVVRSEDSRPTFDGTLYEDGTFTIGDKKVSWHRRLCNMNFIAAETLVANQSTKVVFSNIDLGKPPTNPSEKAFVALAYTADGTGYAVETGVTGTADPHGFNWDAKVKVCPRNSTQLTNIDDAIATFNGSEIIINGTGFYAKFPGTSPTPGILTFSSGTGVAGNDENQTSPINVFASSVKQ